MTLNTFKMSAAAVAILAGHAVAGTYEKTDDTTAMDTTAEVTDTAELATADMMEDAPELATAGMTVEEIIGLNVLTANDETVGEVDYVVASLDGYAAVIGLGGFLGLGEYTVSVPMEEFNMVEGEELRLATWTEEELKALPEIDESTLESLPADYRIDASL